MLQLDSYKKRKRDGKLLLLLPKYLEKRKVQLIRQKIIRRKFGYIFYRKCLSQILPSQADHFYEKNLKRKSFNIWYSFYYKVSIGWKHELKAEIHYNLRIKQIFFNKLKQYCARKKENFLKLTRAILFWEQRKKTFKLKILFRKWKLFMQLRNYKIYRINWAKEYFKDKHYPALLKSYFIRWTILVKVNRKFKEKLFQANRLYNAKLLRKYFGFLIQYTKKRLYKKNQLAIIIRQYNYKLLRIYFQFWKNYLIETLKYKANLILTRVMYNFKIKKIYFHYFKTNVIRSKFYRCGLEIVNYVNLKSSFKKWKNYTNLCIIQKEKWNFSCNFFINKLKMNGLKCFRKYVEYKKLKILKDQENVKKALNFIQSKALKKLKIYWEHRKLKAKKFDQSVKFYNKILCNNSFNSWKNFIQHKRKKKIRIQLAVNYYQNSIVKKSFHTFVKLKENRKNFENKIQQAKTFYRSNLINESIKVVYLAGNQLKILRFNENISDYQKKLFLAEKYFCMWKNKTIYKRLILKESKSYCENSFNDLEMFPLYFLLNKAL